MTKVLLSNVKKFLAGVMFTLAIIIPVNCFAGEILTSTMIETFPEGEKLIVVEGERSKVDFELMKIKSKLIRERHLNNVFVTTNIDTNYSKAYVFEIPEDQSSFQETRVFKGKLSKVDEILIGLNDYTWEIVDYYVEKQSDGSKGNLTIVKDVK